MRMTRMLVAVLAFALLGLSPLFMSSATAQTAERAKESRQVTFLPKNTSKGAFIYGKVEKFKNKSFSLQRRIDKGPWKTLSKVRTKGSGKYQVRVTNTGGTTCFRAKVPGSNTFKGYTTPNSKILCFQ